MLYLLKKRVSLSALIILSIAAFLFNSCANKEKTSGDTSTLVDPFKQDSLKYNGFILDTNDLKADPRFLKEVPMGTYQYNRLITEFKIKSLSNDTMNMELAIYPGKRVGDTHGQNENPTYPKILDTCYRKLPSKLFLGNNYFNWDDIRNECYDMATHKFKANFVYLKFIPVDRTTGYPGRDGHLHYRVEGRSATDKLFPPAGSGGLDSKPSPPAPPEN
jgi:hypothetical protein